jgi:cell division protein FtsZ
MSQEQQSGLLLLGVGGGGSRLASAVLSDYGAGMRSLGVDTDALSNREATASGGLECLLMGGARLAGHGTGGDAIKGRLAAQDDMQNLVSRLEGVRMVVLTACLGAGTGGGATPEIVKALRDLGITTVCFVTMPFGFEGEERRKAAERVLPMIEENADSMVVVSLDDLYAGSEGALLADAVRASERVIAAGISLVWRLVTKPGFIRMDPERFNTMVLRGGNARFGFASADGANRAAAVTESLRKCKLLRSGDALARANAVLLGILAGSDLRLAEIGEVVGSLRSICKPECTVEMGTVLDARFDGRIELVAVTFESWTAVAQVETGNKESSAAAPTEPPPVAEEFPIHSGSRRTRAKSGSKLSFGATGRGKFQNVEPTIFNGQDLDIPTYVRRGIQLDR